MQLKNLDTLKVFANIRGNRQEVGILKAIGTNNTSTRYKIYFEYHENFIQNGFSLSPFTLKLEKRPMDAPCLDYENLLKLCKLLTKDVKEVKRLVKLMVFNVVMNNTDDHAKNFSFLLDAKANWKLAPAYDLAPQRYTVEHMAAVNNKGKNITDNDMIIAASSVGVEKVFVVESIDLMKDLADKENRLIEATKEEILASSQH